MTTTFTRGDLLSFSTGRTPGSGTGVSQTIMTAMTATDHLAAGIFFVVGTGRSGTTLLQAMLTSHSRLDIPPETKFFQRHDPIEPRFGGDPIPPARLDAWLEDYFSSQDWADAGMAREDVEPLMRGGDRSAASLFLAILQAWQSRSGKQRIGEKSPLHCKCVERIAAVFPKAKFIHIYRDPRDVVASMRTMDWTHGSLRDQARNWRKILDEHLRLTAALPSATYAGVRFETLVDQPEAELRRVCDFLGESFEPAMLNFHERPRAGFHDREKEWKGQTQRPLSDASIGRYRQQLSPRQVALVERLAGPTMVKLGYQPVSGWRAHHPVWMTMDAAAHAARKTRRNLGGL